MVVHICCALRQHVLIELADEAHVRHQHGPHRPPHQPRCRGRLVLTHPPPRPPPLALDLILRRDRRARIGDAHVQALGVHAGPIIPGRRDLVQEHVRLELAGLPVEEGEAEAGRHAGW